MFDIRFALRLIKIKLMAYFGYTVFFVDSGSSDILLEMMDRRDVPSNVVPIKKHVLLGSPRFMYEVPVLQDFTPTEKHYFIRVIDAYDGGGLVDGTLLFLKTNDAVMYKLSRN